MGFIYTVAHIRLYQPDASLKRRETVGARVFKNYSNRNDEEIYAGSDDRSHNRSYERTTATNTVDKTGAYDEKIGKKLRK